MLVILSPSKTQSITNRHPHQTSQPPLIDQAVVIVTLLKSLNQDHIAELMKTSPKLTELTIKRINDFSAPHHPQKSGAALTTFQGDAFSAIATDEYSPEDFNFANSHIRILSGLYGILRPLDLIQPYRLEMAAKLKIGSEKTLYNFWGPKITDQLNKDLARMEDKVIVNCASREYSKTVKPADLDGEMVSMTFRQEKGGKTKTIAIYAKRARGMFVDYIIKNRLTDKKQLTTFNTDGYCFAPESSTASEFIFVKHLTK